MNATPHSKFIPVLRRPRCDWTIPAPDAYERLVKEKAEAARAEARWKGTTPYGREISRRMLERARILCEQNPNTTEAIAKMEAELKVFPELQAEFSLVLSNLGDTEEDGKLPKINAEDHQELTWYGMALVLIARSRAIQWCNAKIAEMKAPSAS